MDLETIKKTGITFGTFACLARCQGLTVETKLGSELSIEAFRAAVQMACVENVSLGGDDDIDTSNNKFLAVSYSRKTVGQTGSGHFSPIAAYDEASDQILVLDTARFKYGPHWLPLKTMFDALQPIDPETGKSRGYALLSYEFDDHGQPQRLPKSFLFRSKKSQDKNRRLFKAFLLEQHPERSITFEEVIGFWTRNGTDTDYIWSIIDPQLAPTNEEEEAVVEKVRSLLKELIDKAGAASDDGQLRKSKSPCVDSCGGSSCCTNDSFSRTIAVSSIEAIFVTYLSALPPDERKDIIFRGNQGDGDNNTAGDDDGSMSNLTYEQLQCEVELVQYAIEASDEDA